MLRVPSILRAALAIVSLSAWTATAHAAGRTVVVPVVLGGSPDPAPALIAALAEGLKENKQWIVVSGEGLGALLISPASVSEADLATFTTRLDEALQKTADAPAEAAALLTALSGEVVALRKTGPTGEKAEALAFRAGVLAVTARLKAEQADQAKGAADEVALRFPGRKAAEDDGSSAEARALLTADRAGVGATLTLKTRPEGCEISVGGVVMGPAPQKVTVFPGTTYLAEARCPAGKDTAATSTEKRISLADDETARPELLDVEFARSFGAEMGRRLRFASSGERRQLEDSYARRVAERFDADNVIFVSIGELSGTDWLNGRIYLRSGYLNRQGLVRIETDRARALGRYLATGKEVAGVLRPEEAGQLAAAAQTAANQEPEIDPWYTDIPGWTFTGAGIVSTVAGLWALGRAKDIQEEGFAIRGNEERQQQLYRDAQGKKFWSGVGLFGGALLGITGIALLIVPEYRNPTGEIYVVTPIEGGAAFQMARRF